MSRPSAPSHDASACVVLMFKAPERSKRRLAREIGDVASQAAQRLFDCAIEDLRDWPGPVCFAPAATTDASWLDGRVPARDRIGDLIVLQGDGNLGERINTVNSALWDLGMQRQIMIGIDCPELTPAHLRRAAALLEDHDAALAPAVDGGVVLMASSRRWPPLADLPWSEPGLRAALVGLASAAGWRVGFCETLTDVDTADDLKAVGNALVGDARPARRALHAWLDAHAGRLGGPS
jgi:glycosyltransferase A (GT-A) superfamily protein (DUF2064 family)